MRDADRALGSVWGYPEIISAALDTLYAETFGLTRLAAERFTTSVRQARHDADAGWEMVSIAEGLISVPLGLVCPPAGVALDLAFSLADVVLSFRAYLRADDEYHCALDPREAFAEVEPSVLPLTLSIAGGLLTGVTGLKAGVK